MRATFFVRKVVKTDVAETVTMRPAFKEDGYSADGADPDNTFAHFAPSGKLKLVVMNPAFFGKLILGEKYCLDFTPVPQEIPVS